MKDVYAKINHFYLKISEKREENNMKNELKTSVAVVGAGHAGIEAALASARMGVDTVLFTLSLDSVANMPCNPSIGGTAKGHLVYEIDALGGEMGYAADRVTLQSRTLNLGKGAAVQSKRVQADRQKYHTLMKQTLETTPHLRVVQAEIVSVQTTAAGEPEAPAGEPASGSPADGCPIPIHQDCEIINNHDIESTDKNEGRNAGTEQPETASAESDATSAERAEPALAGAAGKLFHVKQSAIAPEIPRVCSVTTRLGEVWECEAVVIATGTYLDGAVFVGNVSYPAGPDGSLPASLLSRSLAEIGVKLVRFKTGTPARIQKSSIDFSKLEEQPGEEEILPYSYRTREDAFAGMRQIPCHIVYTNAETHRVIRENITRSAMYSGKIHGTGPRYCPSIEDKLVRFADKERHQLFVEPLGENTNEMYLQGFSTSLPTDVQHAMLQTLPGFEHAQIMRYAYAIEYDCADPTQMNASLEFKTISGLFGAGQFNGTSGYEEAAAQGLVAGINAARKIKGLEPMILSRTESYIGTLIDDLVTKGTNEPYRMMTSRSEYRLLLRQDNADARLTPIGHRAGLVGETQYSAFLQKHERIEAEKARLEQTYVSPETANSFLEALGESALKSGASLADLLRRPAVTYEKLAEIDPNRPALSRSERITVTNDVKYAGYVTRQSAEVARLRKLEEKRLPADLCYREIAGLRIEAAQKLEAIKPLTIGQASRISGVNPADISVLLIYLGLH